MKYILLFSLGFVACSKSNKIDFFSSYEEGMLDAKKNERNILLIFDFLGNPTMSTYELFEDDRIISSTKDFTKILLFVDLKNEEGRINQELQQTAFKTNFQPAYYIIDIDRNILKGPKGYCKSDEFLEFLLSK